MAINIPLIDHISKPKAVFQALASTVKLQRCLGPTTPTPNYPRRNTFSVAILSPTIEKSKSRDISRVPIHPRVLRRATPWGVSRTE